MCNFTIFKTLFSICVWVNKSGFCQDSHIYIQVVYYSVLCVQTSRTADEYDYGDPFIDDSFIDDSQLTSPNTSTTTNHWSCILQSPSPRVHGSRGARGADTSTSHSILQSPSLRMHHSRGIRLTRNSTTTSHWDDVVQSPSPQVHDRRGTRRDSISVVVQSTSPCVHERTRRAYLLDYSDTEEPPQSSSTPSGGQCIDDYSESQLLPL